MDDGYNIPDLDADATIDPGADVCDAPQSTPAERSQRVGDQQIRFVSSWQDDEPRCGRPIAAHTPAQLAACRGRATAHAQHLAKTAREATAGETMPGTLTGSWSSRPRRVYRRGRYVDPVTGETMP